MKKSNVVYEPYNQAHPSLLPPDLEELILEDHLIRVVDAIDLGLLEAKYQVGGRAIITRG